MNRDIKLLHKSCLQNYQLIFEAQFSETFPFWRGAPGAFLSKLVKQRLRVGNVKWL
jgi:hypothetical protein